VHEQVQEPSHGVLSSAGRRGVHTYDRAWARAFSSHFHSQKVDIPGGVNGSHARLALVGATLVHITTLVRFLSVVALVHSCRAAPEPPVVTPGGGLVKAPSPILLSHPNPSGVIVYTFDGSDPRDVFGNIVANAHVYTAPLTLSRPMVVRARVKSGVEWSDITAAAFTPDQDFSPLMFTEIMYHPQDGGESAEFVEFKNIGTKSIDLTGLEFACVELLSPDTQAFFQFPPGTVIGPGEFRVLAHNSASYPTKYSQHYPGAPLHGYYTGDIPNSAARLVIRHAMTRHEAVVARYGSQAPWQVVPDNHNYHPSDAVGFSLVRVNYDPNADPNSYRSWRASTHKKGSPGTDDPPPIVPPIYINELLTRGGSGTPDAIEFFNPNPFEVDLGKWWLSDERNDPLRYSISTGTTIPALGYLVLNENQFNGGPNGIAFSADGERCYLFSADADGLLTGYSHGFQFGPSDRDVSFGRTLASDGTEDFPMQISMTFGAANSGPRMSPVVITEVMFRPASGPGYIEFQNISGASVNLWDPENPQNTWALGIRVPGGTTIPANGLLLVVEGDASFARTFYNVPPDVQVFGGASINPFLNEYTVGVQRPSGMTSSQPIIPRYVDVEKVVFTDSYPWPPGAAAGASLERIDVTRWANDPVNWRPSPTLHSAGRPNSGNLPPTVWAGSDRFEFIGLPAALPSAIMDESASVSSVWDQMSGPDAVIFTGPTPAQTTAFFPALGTYVLRLTASDGTFSVSDTVSIEVITRPIEQWRATNFTPAEQSDPAIGTLLADPDRDGRLNVVEYLFDSAPQESDSTGLLAAEMVDGYLQIRWSERSFAPDVIAIPQRADKIAGPWFGTPELFERTEVDLGGVRHITIRDRVRAANRPTGFMRLRFETR
jgi:hypothetical protein